MDKQVAPLNDLQRETWVADEAKKLGIDFAVKVSRGRREHGRDLGTVKLTQLFEEARNEALDQICYIEELRRRFKVLLEYTASLEKKIATLEKPNGQ